MYMNGSAPDGIFAEVYLPRISLSEKGGYIWVDKEREILMSISLFAELRASLLDAHGEHAPTVLFNLGSRAGFRWATNDRNKSKIEEIKRIEDAYFLAAQIIGLGGHGELRLASDTLLENNVREIRFDIYSSSEVEAQSLVAPCRAKCCWLLAGFLSGYMSMLFSKQITFEEVLCRAEGHRICHMVGRTSGALQTASQKHSRLFSKATVSSAEADSVPGDNLLDSAIVGRSSSLLSTYDQLKKFAPTAASVLIVGESGVGKELFARSLHERSPRRSGSFVAVNCGALPDTLIESELFGVEKGAYSGADASRLGRFERAHGGTLFLDEVSSLSAPAQVKLLRALQGGEIERLGGNRTITVDVRLVCASNVDLREAVDAGQFRKDLYFRLSTFTLFIPPLRERREDIPLLVEHYLRYYAEKYRKNVAGVSEDAYQELMNYQYPGNVRELASIIERAVVLTNDDQALQAGDINTYTTRNRGSVNLLENQIKAPSPQKISKEKNRADLIQLLLDQGVTVDEISSSMVALALKKTNGNITKASEMIGMSRRQLSYFVNHK